MAEKPNRYSDSSLNPSEEAYKDSVGAGQRLTDDFTAQDLRKSEEGLSPVQKVLQRRENKKQELREAEAAERNNPDNQFYRPRAEIQGRINKWSNKRKTAIAGGAGGSILAAFSLIFMLLPLKIPGIMQMIADEAGQRVEHITERRAKIVVARYVVTRALGGSGFVVTGDGPVSSLMASMRTSRFEKKLAAKGITIEGVGKNAKVLVKQDVIFTVGSNDIEKGTTTLVKKLDGTAAGRKALNEIVKEEIPSWRWMKRAKFAKWLRIKYSIPRYGVENSKAADEQERTKEMDKARLTTEYEAVAENMASATNDLMEGNSDLDPNSPEVGGDGSNAAVKQAAEATIEETVDTNSDPNKKIVKSLIGNIATKLSSKAIPVVGWIDLLATVDHITFETSENDLIGKISTYYRAMQYSRHYGVWSGYGSQVQLGELDPAFIGVLAAQTEGVEKSQAFNLIEGNSDVGVPVKNKINANNRTDISNDIKDLTNIFGGYDSLSGQGAHAVLNAWYKATNKAFEAIGGVLTGITPEAFTDWMAKLAGKVIEKLMSVMGLDFDPAVKGADWFNAAHGGATWTYNDFCRNVMGCKKLTPEQTTAQNSLIASDRQEYRQEKGLVYALFSPQTSKSLTSQLAVQAPTSPTAFASSLGQLVAAIPTKILGTTIQKTSATNYTDIHGVDPYGATEQELSQPIDPNAASGEPCEGNHTGEKLNLCMVDTLVAEAMICEFEPENIECDDSDPVDGAESAFGGFRIATYNFLGDNHTSGGVNDNARFDRAIDVIGKNKIDVVGLQEFQSTQFERFKARTTQYDIFPTLPTYSSEPTSMNSIIWDNTKFRLKEGGTKPFKYFQGVTHQYPWVLLESHDSSQSFYVLNVHDPARPENDELRYQDALAHAEVMKEFTATGKPVLFTGDFNSGYYLRTSNNITWQNKRENLTYCILTREGIMQNAFDNWQGKPIGEACPTTKAESPTPCSKGHESKTENRVDHIYVSKDVKVSCYWTVESGIYNNGSDVHDTVIADIAGPDYSSNAGSEFRMGSYNLPIDVKDVGYAKAVAIIKNQNFDVVGMQELAGPNYRYMQSKMKDAGYSIYPDKKAGEPIIRHGSNSQSIIWKNEKFDFVKAEIFRYPRYPLDPADKSGDEVIEKGMANAPIVWLKDKKTGQTIVVINIHNAANTYQNHYQENDERRYNAALKFIQTIEDIRKADASIPIFLSGDFNEGTGVRYPNENATYQRKYQNLLYCMFADNNLMESSEALSAGRKTICPNPSKGGVDYIYVSKGVDAKNFSEIAKRSATNPSDHPVVYVDIDVPGKAKSGWVWPMKKGLKPGPCWGAMVFGRKHAGMDINTDLPNNELVAMHSGTIIRAGYDGDAGNFIKVKTGDGMYYIYEHMKSISKRSGDVEAGDVLGIAGKTGNVSASSAAHFHLVVSRLNDFPSYDRLGGSIDPLSVLPKPAPEGYSCY